MNRSELTERYLIDAHRPELLLVDFNHPEGSHHFHNGLGVFEYEGNSYYGTGGLGTVSIGQNQGRFDVQEMTLELSGVDPDLLGKVNFSVRGGTAVVRRVFLRPDDWTVDQVIHEDDADLETMDYSVDQGTAKLIVTASGGVRELRARTAVFWEAEDQRDYLTSLGEDPDTDTGFDLIPSLVDKIIVSQAE